MDQEFFDDPNRKLTPFDKEEVNARKAAENELCAAA